MHSSNLTVRALRRASWLLALLAGILLLWANGPVARAADCPNEALRLGQASPLLPSGTSEFPACMGLEMVSPPKKLVFPAFSPAISADGERVLFRSQAALAETPGQQSFAGDRYFADRGATGWETTATSPPVPNDFVTGTNAEGGPYAFSSSFDSWILMGATQAQAGVGIGQVFSGSSEGLVPLSPLYVPRNDSGAGRLAVDIRESASVASSADLAVTVFHPKLGSTSYLPGDPEAGTTEPGEDQNNYLAFRLGDEPTLQLLARDTDKKVLGGRCGAHIGGGIGGTVGRINQGAISTDGSRIYFSTRPAQPEGVQCDLANPTRIFKRTNLAKPEITELVGPPEEAGDDLYQGASVDGTKVFFTSPRKLTSADKDTTAEGCSATIGKSVGCDLYLYDTTQPEAQRLTMVSAGATGDPTPGKGANVLSSITAVSGDGSHVYFVAQDVLTTTANPVGAVAQPNQPNLYLYERDAAVPNGRTAFIGTLDADDKGSGSSTSGLWGNEQSFVGDGYAVPLTSDGGDGHILLLSSHAPLTADDTDGGKSDVYRYDSVGAGTLQRISKAAPGGSEAPAPDTFVNNNNSAPNTNFSLAGRWSSNDGETVVFSTAEPLVPGDNDAGASNPYLWKEGTLTRLPAEERVPGEEPPTVSLDGSEAGFTTTSALLPQDGDTASDVYVARVDGGFPNPVEAQPCDPLLESSCQGPGGTTPGEGSTATASFAGPGNPKAKPAPKKCKKGFVRKNNKCVKKKANKKKSQAKKRASRKHGGAK